MVRLNRIYTRTGDDGTTALGDGTRRPKHDARIAAYGTVDELSCVLGLLLAEGLGDEQRAEGLGDPLRAEVLEIQNDLFDVGADLCVPGEVAGALRVTAEYTVRLEQWIDRVNADLAPLSSFILPGGTKASAWLHLARTVCRRAERLVTETIEREAAADSPDAGINPEVVRYLNRLSDLLFVLGRAENEGGAKDVLWRPGLRQRGGAQ